MSDYQRFVSYLYEYHKDIKGENRGFVKVDSRNRRCQITLRISAFSLPDGTAADVYGFLRRTDGIAGVFLGRLPASNGCVYGSILADPENLGECGVSLQQLSGMIFFAGNGKIYATQWDDLPILPSSFSAWNPGTDTAPSADTLQETMPDAAVPSGTSPKAASNAAALSSDSLKSVSNADAMSSDSLKSVSDTASSASLKSVSDAAPKEVHIASADEEPETPKDLRDRQWQQVLNTWESFSPFGDDDITDCVKITPGDFPALRRIGWIISPNQFLLYGYYNYRHLMLGRTKTSCIIGVPGVYSAREKFMAELFGYSHFKPSDANMGENVRFGYWYRTLA